MRPIVCNTDLAFLVPEQQERKVCMKRKRQSSDYQVQKVRQKHQELYYQQEANQEYLFDQMSERMEKYSIQKQKQIASKAKYACDYNFRWKQRLQEQKCLSAEREFYFQELHWQEQQKRHQRSKSLAFPKIPQTKKTEPCPIVKKKDDQFFSKLRKIVYCSYQRELKQMKRSFEIAAKLEQDDQRIMKYKTLDCRPKLRALSKHDDDTFLTQG